MQRTHVMTMGLLFCLARSAYSAEVSGQTMLAARGAASGAVVSLEGSMKSTPMTHVIVDQRDKTFTPHVSVVTVGSTMQFPNNDTVFHNVFACFKAKKFDLGMYPHGASKTVTFDKPGIVSLLCNIHSDMSAYVVVVDTPYFAVTDRQGRFQLHSVPPGNYTLHAWHESGAVLTQNITVLERNQPLALSLSRKAR